MSSPRRRLCASSGFPFGGTFSEMNWLLFALVPAAILVLLAFATLMVARRIERSEPPTGSFVEIDGSRVHFHELGSPAKDPRHAFLLLHGANLDSRDMRMALGAQLAALGRVIVPDRPGQGYTPCAGPSALVPLEQARLMRDLLRAKGVERVTLVGHSLGGFIALCFAMSYGDEVDRVILVNPATHPRPGELLWYQKLAALLFGPIAAFTFVTPMSLLVNAAFVRRLFAPESAPTSYATRSGLALGMTSLRFLASMREYAGLRDELLRAEPSYPRISTPTLIVSGAEDRIVPMNLHGARIAAILPHARLVEIEHGGHMLHHAHAAEIVASIEATGPSLRSASAI